MSEQEPNVPKAVATLAALMFRVKGALNTLQNKNWTKPGNLERLQLKAARK